VATVAEQGTGANDLIPSLDTNLNYDFVEGKGLQA